MNAPQIPISPAAAERLKALIGVARKMFKSDEEEQIKRLSVEKTHNELAEQVKRLEQSFDGTDLDALEKLAAKKSQLAIMSSNRDSLQKSINPRNGGFRYHPLMIEMSECLHPILTVALENLKQEAMAVFRPFYQNDGWARDAVNATHKAMVFSNWKSSLVIVENQKKSVERMVVVAEKLLAGEEFWTFDPHLGAK